MVDMNHQLDLTPGKYIVAVSGGVDSVVLLDMLLNNPGIEVVVAHFDHGIRGDSKSDRIFVEGLAKSKKLLFFFEEGKLGSKVSEAAARKARYEFLFRVQKHTGSKGIVTAHHANDVLETAIINMIRGTDRKGLSSLKSTKHLYRPLLGFSKEELIQYALKNNLSWREDSTNSDTKYLRNHIRHKLLTKFDAKDLEAFKQFLNNASDLNKEIDKLLKKEMSGHVSSKGLDRRWFIMLPHNLAKEVMATWLRQNKLKSFDRVMIERLVIASKTLRPGKKVDAGKDHALEVNKDYLALSTLDR